MDAITIVLLLVNLSILGFVTWWLSNRVRSKLNEVEDRHRKRWQDDENE